MDDPNLGEGAVPVLGDGVENEAEVCPVAGFEWSGGERLDIDIWIARANDLERLRLVLRHFMSRIAKEHLCHNSADGAITLVRDLAVQVSDFATGEFEDSLMARWLMTRLAA